MSSFFGNALGGNPFSTPVGSRIEQATDGTLASENWGLNMDICDLVNETEEGPRDAIKALRKRFTQNAGKNYTVIMYSLTVLETCVKNCGIRFQILSCAKDFVMELVKLIGPKNDPPTAVQEKVLSLIQSWADAFRNQPEMSGVVAVYQDLLAKGIEFPPTDLDAMAPIHTPQRSVETTDIQQVRTTTEPDVLCEIVHPQSNVQPVPSQSGFLTPEQRAKLQSELDVVQSNMNVLGELLSEMKPGYDDQQEQPDELELIQELHATCHGMQERMVDLISKLSNDELTAELLRINDDLNNLFLRYSRWEKNRFSSIAGQQNQSASVVVAKAIRSSNVVKPLEPSAINSDSLIDFGDDLPAQFSNLNTGGGGVSSQLSKIETLVTNNSATNAVGGKTDDFDMFAQSRNLTYANSKHSGSSYKDNLEPDIIAGGLSGVIQGKPNQIPPPDLEFDEMAKWLGQTTGDGGEESVTSGEFERFLAERAAAAEQLPTVTTGSTNTTSRHSSTKKDEKNEQLYAL